MSDYMYPSDNWFPPPPGPYSKKKKKKAMARLNTSYWLPRLDEMVLLQPISTRADGASKEEKGRVESVNDQLVKYNRWLTFLPETKPGKRVRSAATELQQSVHDLNTLIASMMIQVDQKIADLQDRTDDFVEAVQDGGTWQTNGDILGLTYDELDEILTKHPHRDTEDYGSRLYETVRQASLPHYPYCTAGVSCRFWDKLFRLIQEVSQCPKGVVKAFHLYVFAKSVILPERDSRDLAWRGAHLTQWNYSKVDAEVVELVRKFQTAVRTKQSTECWPFFDFASARREIYLRLPRWCNTCTRPPPSRIRHPPDPFDTLAEPPCSREPHFRLLENVQKWAYGEIRSGVMLAFSKKLPKELCLAIFEFAMAAEEVPLNPLIWGQDEYLVGMYILGGVKKDYACRERPRWNRERRSSSPYDDFDL